LFLVEGARIEGELVYQPLCSLEQRVVLQIEAPPRGRAECHLLVGFAQGPPLIHNGVF
jgi:hypothetical protein